MVGNPYNEHTQHLPLLQFFFKRMDYLPPCGALATALPTMLRARVGGGGGTHAKKEKPTL